MPEYIRALIVILLIASVVFFLVSKNKAIINAQIYFASRRKLWFFLTITAFLANNFWIYTLIIFITLFFSKFKFSNPPSLFYFLLFLLPPASIQIPGFGIINYLIDFDHVKLLIFVLLVPAWWRLISSSNSLGFGKTVPEKLLLLYIALTVVLSFVRSPTPTEAMRISFGIIIGVYLPYFVFSRAHTDLAKIKDTLSSFVISAAIVGIIGVFEALRGWMLYYPVVEPLGLRWGSVYLTRGSILRGSGSTGQAIVLGFVMVVAIGAFMYISNGKEKNNKIIWMSLISGVIAPLSRGPWVGLACLLITFFALGRSAVANLSKLFIAALLVFLTLLVLPVGNKLINFLPFVGEFDKFNLEYRNKLIENGLITIQRNPFFGASDYFSNPEMQEMIQGQGIVDITNTYLGIVLEYGLVGLVLFCAFFGVIIIKLFRSIKKQKAKVEMQLLGRSLLSILISMLVILSSVSSISVISIVYWTMAGICVAYISLSEVSNERM